MGFCKLHLKAFSGNGFLLSFGLEAHPCSALTSPGAGVAQLANWCGAIGAARCLSRRQGDYGDMWSQEKTDLQLRSLGVGLQGFSTYPLLVFQFICRPLLGSELLLGRGKSQQ